MQVRREAGVASLAMSMILEDATLLSILGCRERTQPGSA